MKRLLIVLLLFAAIVVGVGFYRGWFGFTSEKDDANAKVTFSVDRDKLEADRNTALQGAQDLGRQIKDKTAGSGEKSMDGTVVNVSADKLTMRDQAGKEHSHALAKDVKITCDGKACKADDLKPGIKVRVTAESTDAAAATRIEAIDKNTEFEKNG